MEYPYRYEVKVYDRALGDYVVDRIFDDENEAKFWANHLKQKHKLVHVQQSFENGGMVQNLNYFIGYRDKEFLRSPIAYGKHITIEMPNGEKHKGQFVVVELDKILASHNEKTYGSTIGYPTDANGENVNDRNYTGDVASQNAIQSFAQNLTASKLVTTSRTPSGTPIITIDGIVVSGNNRTMSLKLAAADYPEKYKEYIDFLQEEIDAFGFENFLKGGGLFTVTNKDNVSVNFKHPVLVRIDFDVPAYNALELSKYNKDTKKSERPIDKALKLGKILESSTNCTNIISDVVGQYDTFSEFYSNRNDQKKIKDTLIDCNILTIQELPAYYSETGFTEQGKELIENLLAGLVLSKDALMASNEGGARKFRQTIITSLPILTANKALPENSLNDAINKALIMESTMSASGTSFQDYVAQVGMFGEATSEEGKYMNRLLASGRNNFKKSIESYNASVLENQGESLFGDKPTKDEMFEAHIKSKIDPKERKIIENSEKNIKSIKEPEMENKVQHSEVPKVVKGNPFINGNFYKEKPENILAETYQTKDRWQKPITEYKGSLDDVKRIDATLTQIVAMPMENNPIVSIISEPAKLATDTNAAIIDNFEKAINENEKEVPKKAARKAKAKKENNIVAVEELTDSYSVREVWNMINPEISIEELRVYMWWKNKTGRPIKSENWLALTEMTEYELYYNEDLVYNWVQQGLLYYFDGELLPAYLYLAENVYDKKNRLQVVEIPTDENEQPISRSGADAKFIIERYGMDVYNNQLAALNKVFQVQYENRLLIKGEKTKEGEELVINPTSKFAKEFKIKTLVEGNPFLWKKITAAGNKRYGRPDFLVSYVAEKDKAEFEELSLTDAFCYWLRTDDTIQYQKGMNYADIIKIYIQNANAPATTAQKDEFGHYSPAQLAIKKKEDAEWERLKSKTKNEGDRLFLIFLDKQLSLNDKVAIETKWNRDFNGYVKINYNKVPVAFPCNKYDMGKPMEIRPEKREAVAFTFSEGSGLLAYDVGVGKTPSAIFTICQFVETKQASRPLLVVPNQTYKQWISEFKKFAAHIRINEFYNLDAGYIGDWQDVNGVTKKVSEGSVSIITYEGMTRLGFNEETVKRMKPEIGAILFQQVDSGATDKKKDRETEKLESKIEEMIGRLLSKTAINIEDLGFDFISFDEAHACKKVFTSVAGEKEENLGNSGKESKSVQKYKIQSGIPSSRGVKGFMLCQYIQNTYNGNTLLLTATPFTNSPLEVYSMLAMIAYKKLKKMQLDNLNTFFDTFVATSYEMIINSKLKPERRQVILGFNNLLPLQTLIRRFMNYKTGEEVNVPRPNKIVLPLKTKLINGLRVNLPENEQVSTTLPLSTLQAELMIGIKNYANGGVSEEQMCSGALIEDEDEDAAKAEGVEIDEDSMTKDEKVGVRLLKAMNHARNLALSPYIFSCSGLGTPTAEKYIETSNKLKYVMECIRSIKEYHEKEGTEMSGVVIYMDRGVEYFKLIREYLISNVGFEEHEVGVISAKLITPVPSKVKQDERKEYVKNLFLGERFNEETLEMEKLSGKERLKVVIGSSTIKEGINLQKHSSVLFNCWLDWNPTDIQQLEGRIYRQGNKFSTVRIVNPLMIDSMDIFMFQKLEEKTSRINTIWANEGRTNVLHTEEFNPKDLKYSLIKDANVLAEMELLELGEKIGEDIADAENKIKRNERIQGYANTLESHTKDLEKRVNMYRPLAEGQPPRNIDTLIRLYQDILRKQTDSLGKKMEYDYMRDRKKEREGYYSSLPPETKKYWFDDLNHANRGMIHETRNYLAPNGIEVDNLDGYTEKIKKQIEQLKKDQQAVVSTDAIKNKAREINEQRLAENIEEKSVPQVVNEFKRLNYLLSELKVSETKPIKKVQCPPLDAEGKVRIDEEGLILLDECIKHAPDTKRMHTNAAGEYTEERQKLHQYIIDEVTGTTQCIPQEKGHPIAILMGGAPGSGKSTFTNKYAPYLQSQYIWKVDADAVREYLPEYEGWNSAATHQETRDIVNDLITSFDKPCKHDLLYDGTMSNAAKYIPLVKRLKEIGYLVFIIYMDVPKAVSIERAMNRFRDNKGGKTKYGRYVPKSVIDDFFATGKQGLEEIKNSVDGYIVVDSLTQKITEKGGIQVPQDRNYAEMFEKGKEKPYSKEPVVSKPTKEVLQTRLKIVKKMLTKNPTVVLKARVKIIEKMLQEPEKYCGGGNIKYEGGGTIPNNYVGKTDAEIWDAWTESQRVHFMNDHNNQLLPAHRIKKVHFDSIIKSDYKDLGTIPKGWLKQHIASGQYANGGAVGSPYVAIRNYTQDAKISKYVSKNGFKSELNGKDLYIHTAGISESKVEGLKDFLRSNHEDFYITSIFKSGGAVAEPKIIKLTAKEDKAFEYAISHYLNEGMNDRKAEQMTIEDLKNEFPRLKHLLVGNYKISTEIDSNTVRTKDGVEVEKGNSKYKGHIFYDDEGQGYECLGYFPKLDDCVYRNTKTKVEVVGCMDGFYFNKPKKK